MGFLNATVDLACRRNTDDGLVLWNTIDADGTQVSIIYNSDEDDDDVRLPGYELIGNGNTFDLRITFSLETAMLTRCTVSGTDLNEVKSTAMIYALGRSW